VKDDFKDYESRPIVRSAYQICEHTDYVNNVDSDTWTLYLGRQKFDFSVPQDVVPTIGDWVVYLSSDDIYYCSDEVFRERNIVDESSS